MATVTSINAFPPRTPGRGVSGGLFAPRDDVNRLGAIMSVPNDELARAIGQAVAAGMAIMLSPTSDGGCVGVHIWRGTQKDRRYCTSADELASVLRAVQDIAEAHLAGVPGASTKVLKGAGTTR
jgi:hypothetical protein